MKRIRRVHWREDLALWGSAILLTITLLAFCLRDYTGFWYYWCFFLPVPA